MVFAKKGKQANLKRFGIAGLLLLALSMGLGLRSLSQNALAAGAKFDPQQIISLYKKSEAIKIPVDNVKRNTERTKKPRVNDHHAQECKAYKCAAKRKQQ